ncbi:ImmA/IrrE family metallo-endopeptidase [Lactococcus formosensis subsp. bovis]|uniref:ImmA/IrrE family metallo-endopeptidase n=1 Tax=Lactococcus formosensis TaxID=1281486 RepID=UPI001BD12762|nr:ImmA/IrrE family metallo-endopeptidase [Lactococcus formosensis]
MKTIEYRVVSADFYNNCLNKTNELLDQISVYTNKSKLKITPSDIILYFESHYNILFNFFDSNHSNRYIKFKHLVQNYRFNPLDQRIVNRMSGVTIPEEDRFVIMLNQTMPLPRIIFTILHELCHLHFHNLEENGRIFASKFSGNYPDELIPFEDEANVTASLLFCPTVKLEALLNKNLSFNKVKTMTNMSRKALHSRLLNYFIHISGLSHDEALSLVLNYKEGRYSSSITIKKLINKRSSEKLTQTPLPVKISKGYTLNHQSCVKFLRNLSIKELIFELEYAHSTNNHSLEQLVMNEYYKKVVK